MDHLVTINNNSSEDENTNDSATSASTQRLLSLLLVEAKTKFMKKTGTFNAKEEAQNFLAKQKLWTFRSTRSICMMLLIHRQRRLQLNRLKQRSVLKHKKLFLILKLQKDVC